MREKQTRKEIKLILLFLRSLLLRSQLLTETVISLSHFPLLRPCVPLSVCLSLSLFSLLSLVFTQIGFEQGNWTLSHERTSTDFTPLILRLDHISIFSRDMFVFLQ